MKKESLFIFIQSAMIGIISIFSNALYTRGFDSMQVSALRIGFSALFFLLYTAVVCRENLKINIKDVWMFIIAGVGGLMMVSCLYMYTIKNGGAAVAAVLLYTEPMIVMLVSAFLFHEKITAKKIAALVMTFLGVLLISGFIGSTQRISAVVFLTGIGSAVAYSFFTIFNRLALNKYPSTTVTLYDYIFAAVAISFLTSFQVIGKMISADMSALPWALGLSLICCAIPFYLYNKGLEGLEASKAAILSCVEPVVGALTGILVFKESCGAGKLIGMLLILLSIIILNVEKPKRAE